MDKRFEELTERLVAAGRPADHFSCSEFHELYDGIEEQQAEIERLKCCGNCKHYDENESGMICAKLEECNRYTDLYSVDNWEAKS